MQVFFNFVNLVRMKKIFWILSTLVILGCRPDDPMEINCSMQDMYQLNTHTVWAANIYDIQGASPLNINNDKIEYSFVFDFLWHFDQDDLEAPFLYYFFDSIQLLDGGEGMIKIDNKETWFQCEWDTMDCHVNLKLDEIELFGMLEGKDLNLHQYQIYEHSKTMDGRDTFIFVENYSAFEGSMDDAARKFQQLNVGRYDTIGIQPVENGI